MKEKTIPWLAFAQRAGLYFQFSGMNALSVERVINRTKEPNSLVRIVEVLSQDFLQLTSFQNRLVGTQASNEGFQSILMFEQT